METNFHSVKCHSTKGPLKEDYIHQVLGTKQNLAMLELSAQSCNQGYPIKRILVFYHI